MSKDISLAQRKMNIMLMRGMVQEEHLSHDLFEDSILSDFPSTTTKIKKSLIVVEIEKYLLSTTALSEFKKYSTLSTLKKVDFMSHVRQRSEFSSSKTFTAGKPTVYWNQYRALLDSLYIYSLTAT